MTLEQKRCTSLEDLATWMDGVDGEVSLTVDRFCEKAKRPWMVSIVIFRNQRVVRELTRFGTSDVLEDAINEAIASSGR